MPAVVSNRVKAGPKDRLPYGATEAEFAYLMAKKIARDIGCAEPEDDYGQQEIVRDGIVYIKRALAAVLCGFGPSTASAYAIYDEWRSIRIRPNIGAGAPLVYYASADVSSTAEKLRQKRESRK